MKALSNESSGNTFEGWATKQGHVFKTWKRRWFVLNDSLISYYVSPGGKLKGTIPLESSTVQIDNEVKKKNTFLISTPEKKFHITTDTEEEMSKWINMLTIVNGQKVTNVKLDDFEILKMLGRGSLGKVQLARHIKTNKLYALKSLAKSKLEDNNLVPQTLIEKSALITVRHPFVVSAKYTFQTGTDVFMALDYVAGGELMKYLEIEGKKNESLGSEYDDYSEDSSKNSTDTNIHFSISLNRSKSIIQYDKQVYGGFSLKRVRFYAAEIALAIKYLHSIGFIHRDIKPSNILIDSDGYIKITDFGFVKEKMFDISSKTSTFCGTPLYTAPEIVLGKKYDRSIDWWSFGVLVYEMVFNKMPFYSDNMENLYKNIVEDDLTFPSKFAIEGQFCFQNGTFKKEVPYVLVDFLTNLLQKQPDQRLGFCDEDEILRHPFFEGIDWNNLFNKKIKMEWDLGIDDATYISNTNTNDRSLESISDSFMICKDTNDAFTNFTFVDNEGLVTNM